MLQAIKVRLYPSPDQQAYIARLIGSCRFVYNNLLAFKIEAYNRDKTNIGFSEMCRRLPELKQQEETAWLKEVHSKVLQQSVINLEAAYKSFFKNGTGFPKFKSKHSSRQSCRFPSDAIIGVRGNRIDIIKPLKDIHFKCSRRDERRLNELQAEFKSGTLSRTSAGDYYFSILLDAPVKSLPEATEIAGLDVGIKDFVVTSAGKKYPNIQIQRRNKRKIAKLNRRLSRKVKGSNNRNKARIKLARFHEKLRNVSNHYLHQVANDILSENKTVVVEDLNVAGMLRNHCLARSIQELSLSRFMEILTYKAGWYGHNVIQVDRYFPSSRLCSQCGERNTKLTLADRRWTCVCGAEHDRDLNAAINLRQEGLRILSVGLSSPEVTPGEIGHQTGRRTRNKT